MSNQCSKNTGVIAARIKKARARCKAAATFYFIGLVVLIAALFLPMVTIGGVQISAITFYKPLLKFEAKLTEKMLIDFPVAALFALLVFVTAVNLIRMFAKVGKTGKKSTQPFAGFNGNVVALEKVSGIYSGTLVTYVIVAFASSLLLGVKPSMTVCAVVGVGTFFHFLAGLVGGRVIWFETDETGKRTAETKRGANLFLFFIRNVFQIAATAAFIWFFVANATVNATVVKVSKDGLGALTGNLYELIIFALQVVLLLLSFVLINHAFRATEFNRNGMKGKGMKNFRVFAFLSTLIALGWFVVDYLVAKAWAMGIVYVAASAFAGFLLDCIVSTKKNERKTVVEYVEEEPPVEEPPKRMAYRVPLQCITQPGIFMQPNGQPVMVMPMQFMAQQQGPVAPQPQPAQPVVAQNVVAAPVEPVKEKPVGETTQPIEKKRKLPKPAPAPVVDEMSEITYEWKENGPQTKVVCPYCKQNLSLKVGAPGHRCPSCGKVFVLKTNEPNA